MAEPINPGIETARLVDGLGHHLLAKSAAYTHGSELLTVLGVLVSLLIALFMVRTRLLDRIAAPLEGRHRRVSTFATSLIFFLIFETLRLPWAVFTDWKRERDFGLSAQPLGDFLGQYALEAVISALLAALFLLGVYALIRRVGNSWWIWTGGLTGLAAAAMLLLGPLLIQPLFNQFKPVPPGPVRIALEQIADRSQIPHDRLYVYDGSRQSDVFTANVAGLGPTARIAISDIALRRASLDEVRVVTAHEAGHYVLGHVWRHVAALPALSLLLLFLLNRLFAPLASLLGSAARIGDPLGLPVFMAAASFLGLLATPALNTLTRTGEAQADAYALQTTNLPDALASALLKTAAYRYPRPGRIEEFVFYSHPSVERRIRRAMEWKAAHPVAPLTRP